MLIEDKTLAPDYARCPPSEVCIETPEEFMRRLTAASGTSCVLIEGALDHMATALQQDLDERRDV